MPQHLSASQVAQIREKGRFILNDKEMTQREKIGHIMAMCRDDKGIGLERLPVESVKTLLSADWERLTSALG